MLRCTKGGCNSQPTPIATGLSNPLAIATDGTNVYFTELGNGSSSPSITNIGRVAKCSVTGCGDAATTIASQLENPQGIAVDSTHAYWADYGSGATAITAITNTQRFGGFPISIDGRIVVSPK